MKQYDVRGRYYYADRWVLWRLGGYMASGSQVKQTRTISLSTVAGVASRQTRTTRIAKVSKYQKIAAHVSNLKRLLLHSKTPERPAILSSKVTPIESRFPGHYELLIERIKNHKDFSPVRTSDFPYGAFTGRPIIGEYSRINGGVYLSANAREAIVVDERYGGLELIYSQLMVNFVRRNGTRVQKGTETDLVKAAIELAQTKLTYVSEQTIDMLGQKEVLRSDEKVTLDVFIEHGLGTSRHQVLLAAYLLEKLKDKGYLHGQIILDSTMNKGKNTPEKLIYSSESGDLFVFDPEDNLVPE